MLLGVASKAGGDKRIALSVIVFPPEMKGAAEGNAQYDALPDTTLSGGARTASNMTNANVKTMSPSQNAPRVNSTMTNASVATETAKGDVRYVTLTYKGGEQNILIPPTAPVVAFVPGAKAMTNASNSRVKPPPSRAHGTLTFLTPHLTQRTRGTRACR
jgi:hypothetical protein